MADKLVTDDCNDKASTLFFPSPEELKSRLLRITYYSMFLSIKHQSNMTVTSWSAESHKQMVLYKEVTKAHAIFFSFFNSGGPNTILRIIHLMQVSFNKKI